MISDVSICNLALTHIGQKTISSLTESSEPARKCLLLSGPSRDAVLRAHNWVFATKIEALAEISGEKILGWEYLYKQPTKCLLVRKIYNEETMSDVESQEFKELLSPSNQKAVAARISPAFAEFTVQVTDPNLFDSMFVWALSYKLAAELAQPLTADKDLSARMEAKFMAEIERAKASNTAGIQKAARPVSGFVGAR